MAAFLPGCLIGGVSLIFKDVVEGLGCLLGGFCFGMWVMTLKSGGVSDSTGVKAGVICGLAGGGFSLSFSHHTREPGLIACLSFAGGTVIVLGIDMFSRAGLKEFWLYVWDLNPNLFPLGTKTYPMTRGIKVEIAAIVIIAVCGAMSQMRLWKIIKKKRKERAEKRQKDEEARAIVDEERNREFMKQNKKDHKEWEREFGNRGMESESVFSAPVSSVHDSAYRSDDPSYQKSSSSIKDANPPGIELGDLGSSFTPSRRSSHTTLSTRRPSKDKTVITTSEEPLPSSNHRPKQSNPDALKALEKISERPSRNNSVKEIVAVRSDVDGSQSEEASIAGYWPLGPEVKPLPFKVPDDEVKDKDGESDEDDVKSLATAGGTVMLDDVVQTHGKSREYKPGQKLKHTSGVQQSRDAGTGVDIPHFDDARSSVAATLDGISTHGGSLPALSRSGTPLPDVDSRLKEEQKTYTIHQNRSVGDLIEKAFQDTDAETSKDVDANRRHSMQLLGERPDSNLGSLANLSKVQEQESGSKAVAPSVPRARSASEGSQAKPDNEPVALTKDALPEGQSQTVHLYRTNEWAKHQALAESPEADDIAPPSEEGVTVQYGKEVAAPVNVRSLSQSMYPPEKSPARKKASNDPYGKEKKRRSSSNPLSPSQSNTSLGRAKTGPTPVYSHNQSSGPHRSSSTPRGSKQNLLSTRNSSTNVLGQVSEENPTNNSDMSLTGNNSQKRKSKSPQPVSEQNNLIRLRESKMMNRPQSMSFANLMDTANATSGTGREAEAGKKKSPQLQQTTIPEEQDDDVPLGVRQAQIKRASSQQASQHYQLGQSARPSSTNPFHQPITQNVVTTENAGTGGQAYDSHQPTRGASLSAAERESRLAQWRGSKNPSQPVLNTPNVSNIKIEANRQQMIASQRKQGEELMKKEMDQRMKESAMDNKMRSGEASDLHRKKLQQMQRQASKKTGEDKAVDEKTAEAKKGKRA